MAYVNHNHAEAAPTDAQVQSRFPYYRQFILGRVGLGSFSGAVSYTPPIPTITNILPPSPTILPPNSSIQFDAIALGVLKKTIIMVQMGTSYEVIFDGDSFAPNYVGSVKSTISNGFRFTVARIGGWLSTSISLNIFAIDGFAQIAP
jgi:hypothetical protein